MHAIDAMRRGEIKAFVGLGGNFATAAPDTSATATAMRGLDVLTDDGSRCFDQRHEQVEGAPAEPY